MRRSLAPGPFFLVVGAVCGVLFVSSAPAENPSLQFLLPVNCAELLPDNDEFLGFLETVAGNLVATDKALAQRLFKMLAMRQKLLEDNQPEEQAVAHKMETYLRRFLCYYREQGDPLRQIMFDDPGVLAYIKKNLPSLEQKINEILKQGQRHLKDRDRYEAQLRRLEGQISALKIEARRQAEKTVAKVRYLAQRPERPSRSKAKQP